MPDPYGPYDGGDLLEGSVREYVADVERLGAAAFESCEWLRELRLSGSVERAPPVDVTGINSRHYVAGAMAPLVIDRYRMPVDKGRGVPGEHELVWAVFFAEYSRNAANTVHGGALAAVCDYIGASVNGTTAWLRVNYLKGTPRGDQFVFKICAWVTEVQQNGRRERVEIELSDGDTGLVMVTAEGEFVDVSMPRPARL